MTLAKADTPLEDRYFTRMASSAGDKIESIVPWVRPGLVVDVGAGGGELSTAIAELTGSHVVVVDESEDALRRLRAHDAITTVKRTVGRDRSPFTSAPADTVVFCSVLHEIYSYSADPWVAHANAIAAAAATLRTGGHLVIRDGVMPDHPHAAARFWAPDDELVQDYLDRTPFTDLLLDQDDTGAWVGTRHEVSEALLTLTWGRGSLPRESQERYELATLDGYTQLVEPHGFTLVKRESWTQAGYIHGLREYRIEGAAPGGGLEPWFPSTNALWVFERDAD